MTAVVQESVSGIRLVKSFGGEAVRGGALPRGERPLRARHGPRDAALACSRNPSPKRVGTAIAVAILWVGARMVDSGALTGAMLITFLLLVMRMLQPLKQLSQVPTTAQQSLAAAERIFEVLDSPTEASLDRGTRHDRRVRASARVRARVVRVRRRAGAHRRLARGAPKGEVIALVGASGAGKSTLVDLIPRFYEPTAGRILLDGVDTREIALPALRSLIGIVSQDTVLFNDTVRNNLAYGAAGEIHRRADRGGRARGERARASSPSSPTATTRCSASAGRGCPAASASGSSIARALLVDPPILILDEATSALDTESERLVQEAIDRLLEGRTVFVIAHRLSTIAHADQILVMDRGRVVEHGTHSALLARRGHYHRLHALQFADGRRWKPEQPSPTAAFSGHPSQSLVPAVVRVLVLLLGL